MDGYTSFLPKDTATPPLSYQTFQITDTTILMEFLPTLKKVVGFFGGFFPFFPLFVFSNTETTQSWSLKKAREYQVFVQEHTEHCWEHGPQNKLLKKQQAFLHLEVKALEESISSHHFFFNCCSTTTNIGRQQCCKKRTEVSQMTYIPALDLYKNTSLSQTSFYSSVSTGNSPGS